MLPVACDHGRVNGCEKSRRASGNAANVGGWVNPNDAANENGNGSESEANASACDAKKVGSV